jgi:hypothetical protein
MQHFPKAISLAALVIAGGATGPSVADEANGIFWGLFNNYYGSQQTVCVAKNYNYYPVNAVFNIFPGIYDPAGNPLPKTTVVTLTPYTEYRLYTWPATYGGPGPNCALLHYSVVVAPGGVGAPKY